MKGKKGLYQNYYYKDLLVYDGWVDIPETLLYKIEYKNQFSTKQSKYGSFDKKQYDEVLDYFLEKDIQPIINTYKPIF